jgi:transcriptional regulator with XRE-family HTH domain/transcription elongation factor Elf1
VTCPFSAHPCTKFLRRRTSISYYSLFCDQCLVVNEVEPVLNFLRVEGDRIEHSLEWSCPACGNYHRLPLMGEIEETIDAYNRHLRALQQKINSGTTSVNEEENKFKQRLAEAQKRDQKEGGQMHETRVRFGYWFRRLRQSNWAGGPRGVTEAARLIGISREHLTRIEKGEGGYSQETVMKMAGVIGAKIEMACKMAGIEVPKGFVRKSSEERMREAREQYQKALEEKDMTEFLTSVILSHRYYHTAKRGSNWVRALDVPARPIAIAAAQHLIAAIRELKGQPERVSTFQAIARSGLLSTERYRWIEELVVNVLSGEQQGELREMLNNLALNEK